MFANTGRTRGFLGAGAASVCALGLGAVMGIVPRAGEVTTVRAADARPASVTDLTVQPVDTVPEAAAAVDIPPPAPEPAEVAEVAPPTRQAVAETADQAAESEAVPEPGPVVEPETVPEVAAASVPRRQPSVAEVDQAIAGVRQYVRSLLPISPTHAQVAELGDKICTALDEGQSLEQIKATGAQLVKQVPFATLLPGGDEYILRTGVALYCPGHASKLG